jgi:hypothetical protein
VGPGVLISLTSVPRRFDGALLEILGRLKSQHLQCEILLNIPRLYRKWGAVHVPDNLTKMKGVTVFSPTRDYGPGTNLLGALEYIQNRRDITHIITVDDDIVIEDDCHLHYLAAHARVFRTSLLRLAESGLNDFLLDLVMVYPTCTNLSSLIA